MILSYVNGGLIVLNVLLFAWNGHWIHVGVAAIAALGLAMEHATRDS